MESNVNVMYSPQELELKRIDALVKRMDGLEERQRKRYYKENRAYIRAYQKEHYSLAKESKSGKDSELSAARRMRIAKCKLAEVARHEEITAKDYLEIHPIVGFNKIFYALEDAVRFLLDSEAFECKKIGTIYMQTKKLNDSFSKYKDQGVITYEKWQQVLEAFNLVYDEWFTYLTESFNDDFLQAIHTILNRTCSYEYAVFQKQLEFYVGVVNAEFRQMKEILTFMQIG